MRIAMLGGAYINAGDFLIEERSKALLKNVLECCEVSLYKRNISFEQLVDELNNHDAIVFAGGPLYQKNIYPEQIPFVKDLSRIKKPVMILGAGWYGVNAHDNVLYGSKYFGEKTKEFLSFVGQGGISLGCRDWESVSRLKKEGISNVKMTGCPVWYDLENINKLDDIDYEKKYYKGINRIVISDAAYEVNALNMKTLISFVRKEFPKAEIKILFHRGISTHHEGFVSEEFQQKYHVSVKDISGSAEGFKEYDECDLHIGFRVHAHIYNLSRGNVSVLLNEDARGTSVNNALGLKNIDLPLNRRWNKKGDRFLEDKLSDYFDLLQETKYLQYNTSSSRIIAYYPTMVGHIRELSNRD